MNHISVKAAGDLLRAADDIVILSHQKPDGDTLGSAFALLYALEQLGKRARVECSDGFPERYRFLFGEYQPRPFEPRFVVSVDVANAGLLGGLREVYEPRIDLCIDHHPSNSMPAAHTLLDASAAATCLILYQVVLELDAVVDMRIANALYTGICTDTGCFRFSNVDAYTHRVAAEMIDVGAEHAKINRLMFESMSRGRLEIEKMALANLEYHFDGRCALITVPDGVTERLGVSEEELDGISSLPRRIEGVVAGITLRERAGGVYRVSLRTEGLDASAICAAFGGGGHRNAAGCTMTGGYDTVKAQLLEAVGAVLNA